MMPLKIRAGDAEGVAAAQTPLLGHGTTARLGLIAPGLVIPGMRWSDLSFPLFQGDGRPHKVSGTRRGDPEAFVRKWSLRTRRVVIVPKVFFSLSLATGVGSRRHSRRFP